MKKYKTTPRARLRARLTRRRVYARLEKAGLVCRTLHVRKSDLEMLKLRAHQLNVPYQIVLEAAPETGIRYLTSSAITAVASRGREILGLPAVPRRAGLPFKRAFDIGVWVREHRAKQAPTQHEDAPKGEPA